MAEKISVEEALGFDPMEDIESMDNMLYDGVVPACCDQGCLVKPDGHCPHGNPSILIEMEII